MKAIILVKTAAGKYTAVAKTVSGLQGVKVAFPVMGRTDVVACVEAPDLQGLSNLALKIGSVPNVMATETLVGLEM